MISAASASDLPWRELRDELARFVAARVPASDVDDVVQEALTRIHGGVASVRDHDRLGPWLYQVTRNAIVDHHRRARPVEPLEDELPAPPEGEGEDEDERLPRLLAPCLRAYVGMLPAVSRQAITLVELEGLSQVEAAARLGISVSTMKSRVQRGRAQLRLMVEQCCAIGLDARNHVIDVTPRSRCETC